MDSKTPASLRLGRAIRSRRRALKLTQKTLAAYAGVGVAFLYELEKGKASVQMDKLAQVLDVLGLEIKLQERTKGISTDDELQ